MEFWYIRGMAYKVVRAPFGWGQSYSTFRRQMGPRPWRSKRFIAEKAEIQLGYQTTNIGLRALCGADNCTEMNTLLI